MISSNVAWSLSLIHISFTIGRLCKALHVSFDQAFGIIPDDNEKDKVLLQEQIEKLEEKCSRQERELLHKEELEKRSREILNETARSRCV